MDVCRQDGAESGRVRRSIGTADAWLGMDPAAGDQGAGCGRAGLAGMPSCCYGAVLLGQMVVVHWLPAPGALPDVAAVAGKAAGD